MSEPPMVHPVSDDIHFERKGALGIVTLDRPEALNALTLPMVKALSAQLVVWRSDPAVRAVLVRATGDRAFCAGGDIKSLANMRREEGHAAAVDFYRHEYRMNWRIYSFPKPYVALIDGITMGGGVGISVHGRFRVATERTLFAMPETGIGFFPDVGGTHFLPRCPGEIGMYLGLTGARIRAADCLHAGIATHVVGSERQDDLERALIEAAGAEAPEPAIARALDAMSDTSEAPPLVAHRATIDACFGGPDLATVLESLAAEPTGWGRSVADEVATKSPTSLAVTFRQLREGRSLSFADSMRLEYRLVHRFMDGHDFFEGVRAVIIDKDRRPSWRPAQLHELRKADVDKYFAPLPDGDLSFDWNGHEPS